MLMVWRLYDNSSHKLELIPTHLIAKSLGKLFKFHSNLLLKRNFIKSFSLFTIGNFFLTGKVVLLQHLIYRLWYFVKYDWLC